VSAGTVQLGTTDADAAFSWDNERPAQTVEVPAFVVDAYDVTNAQFMAFVDAGGYSDPRWWRLEDFAWVAAEQVTHPPFWEQQDGRWFWRGMFERVPLPDHWPVYVTWAEAAAFARWRGARLLSEAEFHRAAYGSPDGRRRRYPWGDDLRGRPPANLDFVRWDPDPVDAHPEGASAFGVHGLVGNGWEWTSTVFGPFPGFQPMPSYPEYSADFFDGDHFVLKGASPVTPRELVRPGFRNWFRPRYPYVYATFRCAGPA
jgi:formylglycine-generating enzyme required for sulfatase activity